MWSVRSDKSGGISQRKVLVIGFGVFLAFGLIRGTSAESGQASARSLHVAYRAALSQPAARIASDAEIRAQLRTTPPIAFVNGYWVVPIDLSRVYNQPSLRATLLPYVGGPIGGQHVGFVFIANEFADSFQIPRVDLLRMIGVEALRVKATGSWLHPSGGGLNIMTAIDWIQGAFNWFKAWRQNRQEQQTKKDCKDKGPTGDCDGDGTSNEDDVCPYDPNCGGKKGGFVGCVIITCRMFTTQFGEQLNTVIQEAAQAIRYSGQRGGIVSLGQVSVGRPAINVAFPPGP
jgi:hypothetical protein